MKFIIICSLALYANLSSAVVVWPGSTAPCNTTLDACADNSPRGEVIEIHTNGPIAESVITTSGISLVAGPGFRPVFADGRYVQISGTSHDDLVSSVSGLTFINGGITYIGYGYTSGTTTQLNITNNRILNNISEESAIRVINFYSHPIDINMAFNEVSYHAPTTNIDNNGAISIINGKKDGLPSTGKITGRIYSNNINAYGDESVGIGIYEFSGNSTDIDVSSNVLNGGNNAAMYFVKKTSSTGNSRVDFAHNAIYGNQVDSIFRGIRSSVSDGKIEFNIINNSIAGGDEGFNFQNAYGGIFEINFFNNLVAYNQKPVLFNNLSIADSNASISFDNDNNLFYENGVIDPDFIAGPAHRTDDPKIKSLTDARLKPGSPAIETADQTALFYIISVPLIDADGLTRLKNGNPGSGGIALDIGAYEAGDMRVLDVLKGASNNINPIESADINANTFAKLQITHNWNPIVGSAAYNDRNIGVYRNVSKWAIFTQDYTDMDSNTAFNVWSPAPSSNSFVHTAADATAANDASTELDRSGLNNNPGAILSVTPLWDGVYNDNPVGVFYNDAKERWYIYNSNFVDMPENAQFNVYYQKPSANAFEHRAKAANISAHYTYLDHPLLNNTPCAQFQITHKGVSNYAYRTGVYYDASSQRWAIYNEGLETMPVLWSLFLLNKSQFVVTSSLKMILNN